jgi:hypothetical protein
VVSTKFVKFVKLSQNHFKTHSTLPVVVVESVVWDRNPVTIKNFEIQIFFISIKMTKIYCNKRLCYSNLPCLSRSNMMSKMVNICTMVKKI